MEKKEKKRKNTYENMYEELICSKHKKGVNGRRRGSEMPRNKNLGLRASKNAFDLYVNGECMA